MKKNKKTSQDKLESDNRYFTRSEMPNGTMYFAKAHIRGNGRKIR